MTASDQSRRLASVSMLHATTLFQEPQAVARLGGRAVISATLIVALTRITDVALRQDHGTAPDAAGIGGIFDEPTANLRRIYGEWENFPVDRGSRQWGPVQRIFQSTMTQRSTVVRAALAVALSTTLNLAFADGAAIALHGNYHGAPACSTCHGALGEGTPAAGYPRLAGLGAGYLAAQLDAFASGQRNNPVMAPVARKLTSDERAAVARYYAALAAPIGKSGSAPGVNSPGALLFNHGRWSQGLPACSQCHGPGGEGVGTTFPALTAQSASYIENQLHAWQKGARPPGPLALMSVVASKLSDSDIKDLAAYISAIPASTPFRRNKP